MIVSSLFMMELKARIKCLLILFYECAVDAASWNLKIEWGDPRNEDRPISNY